MQTAKAPRETYSDGDADFYPQILRDFEANQMIDVLAAIGHSTAILAEAALYVLETRGPTGAKRFLEMVKTYTPN